MHKMTAVQIHSAFLKGELSARKIVDYTLERIKQGDPSLQAFLTIYSERMQKRAEELDQKRKEKKKLGRLAAVPIAIKDNIHVEGEITTCASKFLSNYRAPFSSTVVRLLEEEDALIVGKTNLDEFAMGSSTEHSAYQRTKNPWNLDCSPGGSSGGSAACVAARFCPLSLGSDTGGSIRQPAAFCGIVGFKPTYGRVSRYGLVAFGSSLDQIGPFSTTVEDTALIMEVLSRHCTRDSTSANIPGKPYVSLLGKLPTPLKVGVPKQSLEGLSKEARENFLQSLEQFKKLGAEIVDIELDLLKYGIAVYYILATAEASTNLARYDGIRYGNRAPGATTLDEVFFLSRQEGFGAEVKNRILLGTYVLSSGYKDAYYKKAQKVRTLFIREFQNAFTKCSIIVLPTTPSAAFRLGQFQDPLEMYLQDLYTIPANLAGLPAINIPAGFSQDRLPFGLQLIGPVMQEERVLAVAHAFEKVTRFNEEIPPQFA